MLEITPDDIASLDDDHLRSLVGHLCEAEIRTHRFPTSAVTWGGNQNAPDGGIDVRVSLPTEAIISGFLPRAKIGFQVKKTDFTPSLIGPEMRPSNVLRPSILSLAEEGGAYIIASCGTDASDSALTGRLAAMRDAIAGEPNASKLHIDFYDRSRLATWTRSHPGLMLWVRQRIGRSIKGWRSYESWAFSPEGLKDVYLLDDKARLHAGARDEKGIPVSEGIQRLRQSLRDPRGVVRLAGLSGVGKTRLVQALFDDRIGSDSLDPSLVVYADMSDEPDPQPTGMAHDLIATRKRSIIVVDNCAPDLHRRLSELCRTQESTISAITVEYDIREDEPEGTEVFRLEPSSSELVVSLLERRFPTVSKVDAHSIARVSGGNARVAIALANTLKRNETLAGLKDEELFARLFHQRQARDDSLLKAAQACALLYSFQGESLSGPDQELPYIASLIGITAQELFAKVAELKQRDLVQRRGEWRAVLPHAIANQLAAMALRAIPSGVIEAQFTSERMLRSFTRRLGYLHDCEEAALVAKRWLDSDGMLNDIATLNEFGLALFYNIAPIAPSATLAAIERALKGKSAADFIADSQRRDKVAHLLRSLAFDATFFERSVAGLIQLTEAELDNDRSQPIRNILCSLFHLIFSGTHASVEQRASIVERLLLENDEKRQTLGIKLLHAMLKAGQFSSSYSFEFGTRPRNYGFWPKTNAEVQHWYRVALQTAKPFAISANAINKSVASEIAAGLRGLWNQGADVQTLLETITEDILSKRYWQDGWIAVRTMLTYSNKKTTDSSAIRLRDLEKRLRPKNVVEQVWAIVLSQSWGRFDYADIDENDVDTNPSTAYQRANIAAEELGKETAKDEASLKILLPEIVKGGGARLSQFGKGLAFSSKHKRHVWNLVVDALGRVPRSDQDASVFTGYLNGLQEDDAALVESLLDEAVEHPHLASWFPVLQTSVPITESGVQRIKRAIALGRAPIWQYRNLGWARDNDAIAARDIKSFLSDLSTLPSGYSVAIDILTTRLDSDRENPKEPPIELIEAGRDLLLNVQLDQHDQMRDHRLKSIVNACLKGSDGEEIARDLCCMLRNGFGNYTIHTYHVNALLESLFKTQPRIALDVFFEGTTSEQGEAIDNDTLDDPSEIRKNPLDSVSDDDLAAWCAQGNVARYLSVAKAVTCFRGKSETPVEWTPVATMLLRLAPDPSAILEIFIERFSPRSWSGSRASIMESRARLLDDLADHTNPAIAALAVQKRPEFQLMIEREREWETKYDKERDERFE